MENNTMKIEKLLITEDLLNCLNILSSNLTTETNSKTTISAYLKKDGKPTYQLLKAKAAAERLNILLEEFIK